MSAMARKLQTDRMAWLGPNWFILGDGGFSLADIMMVPYANPRTKIQKYFNFCLSSTRFVIEETFGRWKNCFRQLMDYQHCQQNIAIW
eukprot:1141930-Rhodomonas_salina.1